MAPPGALDDDLRGPEARRVVGGLLQRSQLDPTSQLAHERVRDGVLVVDERIGHVPRQRDRRGEGQAVLSAEHVVGLAGCVPLLHDAGRAADRDARDRAGVERMLALEVLDRLDHRLLRDVGRVRLERRGLDGPLAAELVDELLDARRR